MAEFQGSPGIDTFVGGAGDDTFISQGGRDSLTGAGGNDRFILDGPLTPGFSIDGGEGQDSLILRNTPTQQLGFSALFPAGILTTNHGLVNGTTLSIETVEFQSAANTQMVAAFGIGGTGQFAPPNQLGTGLSLTAHLIGGSGFDTLALLARYDASAAGEITINMPTFTYENWSAPARAYLAGDRVVLSLAFTGPATARFVVNGSEHEGVQVLTGGLGADTINGSEDMDFLSGGPGFDIIDGNGGDDTLALFNQISTTVAPNGQIISQTPSFDNGFGLWDGGDGFDFLAFGGVVEFTGTVQNVEGIYLAPAYASPLIPNATVLSQEETVVFMDRVIFDQLPEDVEIDGSGSLVIRLGEGDSFDGSAIKFTAGADVVTFIEGSDDGDENIIGTSGIDVLIGEAGDDTLTGGAGDDIFLPSLGKDIVTDFTIGEDRVSVFEIGISSLQQMLPFVEQVGADVLFSVTYGGELNTFTLENVDLGKLTDADFVFASKTDPRNEEGTEFADVILGQGGNDVLQGLGGDDTIISGGGRDTISGGSGNDRIILDGRLQPGSSVNGDDGVDTLVVPQLPPFTTVASVAGPIQQSSTFLQPVQLFSIERLEFQSAAGTASQVVLGLGGLVPHQTGNGGGSTGLNELVGGAGADTLLLLANHQAGGANYTLGMTKYTQTNWDPAQDQIVMLQQGNANGTINIADHVGRVLVFGGAGNDTINGTDGQEQLSGGTGGVDILRADGGDDALALLNNTIVTRATVGGPTTTTLLANTGEGSVFDGGSGFDVLTIGGVTNFKGTIEGIEALFLNAAFSNTLAPGVVGQATSQAATELSLTSKVLDQLPSTLSLRGQGGITVQILAGDSFDGSGFTFDANANVNFEIRGSDAADTIVGTARGDEIFGGAGGDTLSGGLGDDVIDGEAGNDIALFAQARSAYQASSGTNGAVVISGAAGNDTFANVETFRFADGDYVWNSATSTLVRGISGVVADGHISGATVYVDVNNNGQLDAGEPTAITKADGTFVLASELTGPIRAFGGTDTATGEANLLTLSTPQGSSVVNPLTTLIQALIEDGATPAAAEAQVEAAFGLDPSLELTKSDPIDAAGHDPDALAAQKAAVATAEVAAAVAENSGSATATFDALAQVVQGSGGALVNLAAPSVLTPVISAGLPGASQQTIAQLVAQSQTVVTAVNSASDLEEIVDAQVNLAPQFAVPARSLATFPGTGITFTAVATDDDGDTLTYSASAPTNGAITAALNGTFTYAPNAGFSGQETFTVTADDGFGSTATQTFTVNVGARPTGSDFRMFARDGFTGSVGGNGQVIGTLGFQDISVLDVAGSINFDPSFNKGNDVVRLAGDAADWNVVRSGSNAVFSDGDTFVVLPISQTGMAVVFDDGARSLKFDAAQQGMTIGGQAFGTTLVPITAAADGTTPATGSDPAASARLFLAANADVSLAGTIDVFGTNGAEEVDVLRGSVRLDPSFNQGGDVLKLHQDATTFTAVRSGSNVVLDGGETDLIIPLGTAGMTLSFNGDDRTLVFDTAAGNILIGSDVIGLAPTHLSDIA